MLNITMVGHSTFIVDFSGTRILTDPCFSPCAGFPEGTGVSRKHPLGLEVEELPDLDFIVCTHDHPDHFDLDSLHSLVRKPLVFVPNGVMAGALADIGFQDIVEVGPWDEERVGGISIIATPAIEGADNRSQVGFVFKGREGSVYFGGDTMLFPEMEEIGRKFGIDVALTPVNGLEFSGRKTCMDPRDAAEAVVRLNAKMAIPHHYDMVFGLPGSEIYRATGEPEQFAEQVREMARDVVVKILAPGETGTFEIEPWQTGLK